MVITGSDRHDLSRASSGVGPPFLQAAYYALSLLDPLFLNFIFHDHSSYSEDLKRTKRLPPGGQLEKRFIPSGVSVTLPTECAPSFFLIDSL